MYVYLRAPFLAAVYILLPCFCKMFKTDKMLGHFKYTWTSSWFDIGETSSYELTWTPVDPKIAHEDLTWVIASFTVWRILTKDAYMMVAFQHNALWGPFYHLDNLNCNIHLAHVSHMAVSTRSYDCARVLLSIAKSTRDATVGLQYCSLLGIT